MDRRRRYRAADDSAFAHLLHRRQLAGFDLQAMEPFHVCDVYLDTGEAALLAQGLILRLREREGDVAAALRHIDADEALITAEMPGMPLGEHVELPHGELRDAVWRYTGGAALQAVIRLRQYRTPRALYDAERLVAVACLDVVADQTRSGHPVLSNEVEVELGSEGVPEDLSRLEEALLAMGLQPDPYTKFARAFYRRALHERDRVWLLPAERAALEALAASQAAVGSMRAAAILMASAGEDDREISRRVGLAPSRVRHWREMFRVERLRIFDAASFGAPVVEAWQPELTFAVVDEPGGRVRLEIERDDRLDFDEAIERIFHAVGQEEGGSAGASPGPAAAPDAVEQGVVEEVAGDGAVVPPIATAPEAGSDIPSSPESEAASVELDQDLREWAAAALHRAAEDLDEAARLHEAGALGAAIEATRRCDDLLHVHLLLGSEVDAPVDDRYPEVAALRAALVLVDRVAVAADAAGVWAAEAASPEERLAFALARMVWNVERRALVAGGGPEPPMAERLRGLAGSARAAALEAEHRHDGPRAQLRDMLGSATWRQYERLRQLLREDDPAASAEALARHAELLARSVALLPEPRCEPVLERLREALQDLSACLALRRRLTSFADDWLEPGGLVPIDAVTSAREQLDGRLEGATSRLGAAAAELAGREFRIELARALASI